MIVNNLIKPWGRFLLICLAAFSGLIHGTYAQQLEARDYAVELTADVKENPAEIALKWRGDAYARNYTINRKARHENQWSKIGTAAGHETWFVDRNVSVGAGYEYQVVKEGTLQYVGYGYIYAGIQVPLVEDRGRIILLVEESVLGLLAFELDRLEFDLIGDGWRVVRRSVARSATPNAVKEVVRSAYLEDPSNTRALLLFGNIPVPFSGNFMPDHHADHTGAWPADVYYADVDGAWTDSEVSWKANSLRQDNFPDDGRFDQNSPPSGLELQLGRVDLSRMTCFLNKTPSRNEIDLLRGYLEKNHAFRHGKLPTDSRSLVFDQIGSKKPEWMSTMAWRNFAPFVGAGIDVVGANEYLPAVTSKTYLWTSVVAGGGFTHADGVGSADAFAFHTVNAVFTMFCGSYYGDWDTESNFLRAALGGSGRVLAALYSGQPQWSCHTMALGEPIGAAAKITQENNEQGLYPPHLHGAGQVHIALLGDPTVRAHPVAPPQSLRGTMQNGSLFLFWDGPAVDGNYGYLIYAADSPFGPYRRISPEPIQGTAFSPPDATKKYMVKSVALTTSPSGSYWNASQGVFWPDPFGGNISQPPRAPRSLIAADVQAGAITLRWVSTSQDHNGFEIERTDPGASAFVKVATVSKEKSEYVDSALSQPGRYAYRVRAINAAGASQYSNSVFPTTLPGIAEFQGLDRLTKGQWMGTYGSAGQLIPGISEIVPSFSYSLSNSYTFRTHLYDDPRGLQVQGETLRSVNSWNHVYPMGFHLQFSDDHLHQVAFYLMDFHRNNPTAEVEVYDAVTRNLLDRRSIQDINEGVYLLYNLRRSVVVRIVPPGNFTRVELYGIFIDDPKIQPVRIEPGAGTFAGKTLVKMSCVTPQVTIRYTTDGSEPTLGSQLYAEPFWLFSDAHFRARAFRDGYPPSAITEVHLENELDSSVGFLRWDVESSGNWLKAQGKEGYWVAGGGKNLPGIVEVSINPQTQWIWSDTTEDTRAPFGDATGVRRVAGAWYDREGLVIDLAVFDTRARAVSLYFLDWDRQGRSQRVELLDGVGTVLQSYSVESFESGKYLVLAVKGFAKIRITKVNGPNALLNGMFFDSAPLPVNVGAPVPLRDLRVRNGEFSFIAMGEVGQRFCLDESFDLRNWQCLRTNVLTLTLPLTVPIKAEKASTFLRGHIVP